MRADAQRKSADNYKQRNGAINRDDAGRENNMKESAIFILPVIVKPILHWSPS